MAKNEFNAKGRRMVFEEDIEKIGKGGGGDVSIDDFKAGPGIALDEDLSTNQIVIEVEQEDIPFKTDFKTINNESIIGTGNIEVGGDVSIDNKTIIKNENDELETAVGGWKEDIAAHTTTIEDFTHNSGTHDFDKVDATIASNLFTEIKNLTSLTVTFNFSDGTNTHTGTGTYSSIVSSSTQWNTGGNIAYVTADGVTYAVQMTVNTSTGKIHLWFQNNSEITIVSSIDVAIPVNTVYHQIDSNYLPDSVTLDTDQTILKCTKTFNKSYGAIVLTGGQVPLVLTGSYACVGNQNAVNATRAIRFNDGNPPSGGTVGVGGIDLGVRLGAAQNPERNGATSGGIEFYVGTQYVGYHPAYCYYMDNTSLFYVKDSSQPNGANLGTSACLFHNLYMDGSITDGTNSVSLSDLAALIAYAKAQGWIQ